MRQERCGGPPLTRSFPTHYKVTTSVVARWEFLRPTTCTSYPTSLGIRTLRAMAEENGGVGIRTRRHLTNSDRHLIWMEGNFWTKIGKQWCSEHYRVPWLLRLFAREPHTIPIQPLPYLLFGPNECFEPGFASFFRSVPMDRVTTPKNHASIPLCHAACVVGLSASETASVDLKG